MITIKELKAIEDSPFHACQECFVNNQYDKLSYYMEWLFLKLKFSGNQVSITGLIFGMLATVFLSLNYYLLFILAGILAVLSQMTDLCDGRVMIYRKKHKLPDELFRKYGLFFDWIENVTPPFLLIALGISFAQRYS